MLFLVLYIIDQEKEYLEITHNESILNHKGLIIIFIFDLA